MLKLYVKQKIVSVNRVLINYLGLETLQVTREIKKSRIVTQQVVGGCGVRVMVARQMRAHVASPRRCEAAARQRALEGARLRMRSQPVLGHARQETHTLALAALE